MAPSFDSDPVAALCRRIIAEGVDVADPAHLVEMARRFAGDSLPLGSARDVGALADAAVAHLTGLGPLQPFLADPRVNEIMVNSGGDVWVERQGTMAVAGRLGPDVASRLIERILSPLGRRIDRLSPIVDARLPDGSRVCAVIPPIAVDGVCFTLRRFTVERRPLEQFATPAVADLLRTLIERRCNIVVSGATSSGKTSLLNALVSHVVANERIITLEDTAELRLDAAHVLRLETRPAGSEGAPAITMADLVRTSLRLRPDRIVVGEVRGAEVVDMLQAMNTGHDGSLTTCHANSPRDALLRLESLIVQHTSGWPIQAARDQINSSIDAVVHVRRGAGGRRQVSDVLELANVAAAAGVAGAPGGVDAAEPRALVTGGLVVGAPSRGRM